MGLDHQATHRAKRAPLLVERGLEGGGGSGAGSPGSASQVLVEVLVFCFVVAGFGMLLCREIPGNQYAQHVGMFASLTCTTI